MKGLGEFRGRTNGDIFIGEKEFAKERMWIGPNECIPGNRCLDIISNKYCSFVNGQMLDLSQPLGFMPADRSSLKNSLTRWAGN